LARSAWDRQEEIEDQTVSRLTMKQQKTTRKFVICIRNEDSDDLVRGKVYLVLPDGSAARSGYLRVVDESGEDYLYPATFFVPITLPIAARRALVATARLATA
jgi:hypothetical protein